MPSWQQLFCTEQPNVSIFLYICYSIFSQHYFHFQSYITLEFSDGMQGVAIRHSTQQFDHVSSQDFYEIYFTREKYPLFRIMPYSCHHFCAARILVNNYFQKQRTGRVTFHQKSDRHLENSLKTAITSNKPN